MRGVMFTKFLVVTRSLVSLMTRGFHARKSELLVFKNLESLPAPGYSLNSYGPGPGDTVSLVTSVSTRVVRRAMWYREVHHMGT
jgi:hypothetical protein